MEVEVAQHGVLGVRVGERDVLEADLPVQRQRHRLGLFGYRHQRFLGHQLVEVVQVEVVLVHPGEAGKDALDRVLDRGRGLGVGGQVTEGQPTGDRLQRHI